MADDKGKGGAEKSVKDKVRMLTETMRTYPHRVDEQLSSITQLTKLVQQDAGHHHTPACLPACLPAHSPRRSDTGARSQHSGTSHRCNDDSPNGHPHRARRVHRICALPPLSSALQELAAGRAIQRRRGVARGLWRSGGVDGSCSLTRR